MEKLINQDSKQYRFNPGKNGSLTAQALQQSQELVPNRPHISKVIPKLKEMRKNRFAAQTLAARG
jgi:hypothetical protein